MKRQIMTLLTIMLMQASYSQSQSDIYMIGTSKTIPGSHRGVFNGFGKYTSPKSDQLKTDPIIFSIGSSKENYEMWLEQFNYIKSSKSDKVIIDKNISYLNTVTVIDIDNFMSTKSCAEIWQWMRANCERTVWVIDRNDFFKSSSSLNSNDMMKLIQTEINLDNIPDEVFNQ